MVYKKKDQFKHMKKIYLKWIVGILVLAVLLIVRVMRRTYTFSKLPFKNKDLIEIKFNDIDNRELIIKKENNNWSVSTLNKVYLPNEQRLKEIEEKIKKLELLEIVTKNKNYYSDYLVNNESATIIVLKFKQHKKPFTLFLGKAGGFSYNESYLRLDSDPKVYLARDIRYTDFKTNFYDFCNRTILKAKIDNVSKIYIKHSKREIHLKQHLEGSTTTWINVKTSKKIEKEKVEGLLRIFDHLIADLIVEEDEINVSKLSTSIQLNLDFIDNGSVEFYMYDEQKRKDFPIYVSKIVCKNKSESIEFVGKEDILYAFFRYKYDDLDKKISELK